MPFIYRDANKLQGHVLVGEGDCVELIKAFAPGLKGFSTSMWRAGEKVVDSKGLAPGTAIATFENGRYLGHKHGNHAAFFVAYGGKTIWVIDQWKDDPNGKPTVSKRPIRPGRTLKHGTLVDPSNSSQAFYVIEIR